MDVLDAQIQTIGKVRDAITNTTTTLIKGKIAKEKCEEAGGTWKDGKCNK